MKSPVTLWKVRQVLQPVNMCVEQDRSAGLQCHIHLRDGVYFL